LGLRLNISRTTAEPMEPAPPMTKKREEDIRRDSSFSWQTMSEVKSGVVRPMRERIEDIRSYQFIQESNMGAVTQEVNYEIPEIFLEKALYRVCL
jgi:hypothetical protein